MKHIKRNHIYNLKDKTIFANREKKDFSFIKEKNFAVTIVTLVRFQTQ